MGLSRKVSFIQGLRYHGGNPMWAWILHRITGLSILLFVSLHVVASFFSQQLGIDLATTINDLYKYWLFQIYMTFCVLFHALNGLRIIILDFLPKYQDYQKETLWLQWFVFAPIFGLTIFILIRNAIIGS